MLGVGGSRVTYCGNHHSLGGLRKILKDCSRIWHRTTRGLPRKGFLCDTLSPRGNDRINPITPNPGAARGHRLVGVGGTG